MKHLKSIKNLSVNIMLVSFLLMISDLILADNISGKTIYQHDPTWPMAVNQFNWGVDEKGEANTTESATGVGVDRINSLVYVLVRKKPNIRVFSEEGEFIRAWSPEKVGRVHMLHVDLTGNIWIADSFAHTVTQYNPMGKVLTTLGTFGEPGMDDKHFNQPTDVSTTDDGNTIFVADGYVNKRIAKFSRSGKYLGMWGGAEAGIKDGKFILPHSITVINDRVYVADREGGRIQVFDLNGNFIEDWRDVFIPWGVASFKNHLFAAGQRFTDGLTGALAASSI